VGRDHEDGHRMINFKLCWISKKHLADPSGVLVADETGFLKKSTKSAGVNANTPAPPGGSRTVNSAFS
jgi:hypothetical protein